MSIIHSLNSKPSRNKIIFFFLGIILLIIGQLMKTLEYKLSFLVLLGVFAIWLFIVLKVMNPKKIISTYWNNLKLNQELVDIVSISIAVSFLSLILLILYQENISNMQNSEKYFNKDFIFMIIFVLGTAVILVKSFLKLKKPIPILSFWSKNIALFSSFMIFASSLAIFPSLYFLSVLSPFLQAGFLFTIFIGRFNDSENLLRDIVGLMIIGLIISNSFTLVLGWGGTADEIRLVLSDVFNILDDMMHLGYERKALVENENFSVYGLDDWTQLFEVNSSNNDEFTSINNSFVAMKKETFANFVNDYDSSAEKMNAKLDKIEERILFIKNKSTGLSIELLSYIESMLDNSRKILDISNNAESAIFLLNSAILTGESEQYAQVAARSKYTLDNYGNTTYVYDLNMNSIFSSAVLQENTHVETIPINSTTSLVKIHLNNILNDSINGEIMIMKLPQCRFYPITGDRNWQGGLLSDNFEVKLSPGKHSFEFWYSIHDTQECKFIEDTMIFFQGETNGINESSKLVYFSIKNP